MFTKTFAFILVLQLTSVLSAPSTWERIFQYPYGGTNKTSDQVIYPTNQYQNIWRRISSDPCTRKQFQEYLYNMMRLVNRLCNQTQPTPSPTTTYTPPTWQTWPQPTPSRTVRTTYTPPTWQTWPQSTPSPTVRTTYTPPTWQTWSQSTPSPTVRTTYTPPTWQTWPQPTPSPTTTLSPLTWPTWPQPTPSPTTTHSPLTWPTWPQSTPSPTVRTTYTPPTWQTWMPSTTTSSTNYYPPTTTTSPYPNANCKDYEEYKKKQQDINARYKFESQVVDGMEKNYQHRQETRENGVVTGQYSSDDGYALRTTYYVADKNGYRVIRQEVSPSKVYSLPKSARVRTNLDNASMQYQISPNDIKKCNETE